ncbi:MAG: thioredoxin family protein [Bacteroidota bacterium]
MKQVLLTIALMAFAVNIQGQGYEPGDKARDFDLKNIDGSTVSLSDYPDAKGFIVIFTCNHCPYSQAYEDRIVQLDKTFKDKGYPVIAINPNDSKVYPEDSFENMKKRAENKGFTFPYLVDETQEIAKTYGAKKTPHVFLLNKESGDLIVRYIGTIDDNYQNPDAVSKTYVADATTALLNGNSVKQKTTKAVGCGIKWKD